MEIKRGAQLWWTLASLVVIAIAIAAPDYPLIPAAPRCTDLPNTSVCLLVDIKITACCIGNRLYDCYVQLWEDPYGTRYPYHPPGWLCFDRQVNCISFPSGCGTSFPGSTSLFRMQQVFRRGGATVSQPTDRVSLKP
jgi:hypothetical protein